MGEAKRRKSLGLEPTRKLKGQPKPQKYFQSLPSVGERIVINGIPYFRDSGGNLRLLNGSGKKRLAVLKDAQKARIVEELETSAVEYKAKLDAQKENEE